MLFEDLIEEIGGFGAYQIRLFVVVSLFESPAAWTFILPVFTSMKNPLRCSHQIFPDICANLSSCTNLVYSNPIKTSVISEWDLVCDKSYIPVLINTLQMAGPLLGAGITGQLADIYGRRITLYSVYMLMLLSSLVSSFVTSWPLYAACRTLVGMFFGGVMVVNFVLPMEFVGKSWRTFCGCIGFWAVGVMSLPLLAYLVPEWRHLTALTATIGLLLLPTYWWVHESPRWLIQKGRIKQAKKIIEIIAVYNGKEVPDLKNISTCIQTGTGEITKKYSYWNLFRTPSMSKNAIIIIFCWFVSGSVYYGSTYSVGNLTGSSYMNLFFSGLVEIPALLFVVFINNRIGRRWTLCIMMSLAGVSYLNILVSLWIGGLQSLVWIFALFGKAGIAGAWASAQIYSAEVFPTVVRNIGIGCCSMASRVGLITVPQMMALNEVITFLWCASLTVMAAILSFFLPETLNKCLPDRLPSLNWPCCHANLVVTSEDSKVACDDTIDINEFDNSHFYRMQDGVQCTNL